MNFPSPISTENDLIGYENYLRKSERGEKAKASETQTGGYELRIENSADNNRPTSSVCDASSLTEYLKTQIGKLVRIESLIGDRLERRIGTLIRVGNGFAVIKLYGMCGTMICEMSSVKYITVIHDNDASRAWTY